MSWIRRIDRAFSSRRRSSPAPSRPFSCARRRSLAMLHGAVVAGAIGHASIAASDPHGGAWRALGPPVLPNAVGFHDVRRDAMVILGDSPDTTRPAVVWTFSLTAGGPWTPVVTDGDRPPQLAGAAVIPDPERDRIIVVADYPKAITALDLQTRRWSRITPQNTRFSWRHEGIAYDAAADRLYTFGGYRRYNDWQLQSRGSSQPEKFTDWCNDVWSLDLSGDRTWTHMEVGDVAPYARADAILMFDPGAGRLILCGGGQEQWPVGDLWVLSLGAAPRWQAIPWKGGAFASATRCPAALDASGQRIAILGSEGQLISIELGDSAVATALEIPPPLPAQRAEPVVAFGPGLATLIMAAGGDGVADVWKLTCNATPQWVELFGSRLPARKGHAAVFDPVVDRIVLFGGIGASGRPLGDVYAGDRNGPDLRWSSCTPGDGLRRAGHTAVCDPATGKVWLFGGYEGTSSSDTWMIDPLLGYQERPGILMDDWPRGRRDHVAVFDADHERMVVFGGVEIEYGVGRLLNDAWALSYRLDGSGGMDWVPVVVSGDSPAPMSQVAAAWDSKRHRMILVANAELSNEVECWSLELGDTPRWTRMASLGPPENRVRHAAVYDPENDRLLVFGGSNGITVLNDLWSLPLEGEPRWQRLGTESPPEPRESFAMVYVPQRHEVVVIGGAVGDRLHVAAWSYGWVPDVVTPTLAALIEAEVSPAEARLAWHIGGIGADPLHVERSRAGGPWIAMGSPLARGPDIVTFTDATVLPGERLGYRLIQTSPDGETRLGEVAWLDVPRAALTLERIAPQPARTSFRVTYRLASRAPASLELFDLQGRRVWSLDVEAGAPGSREVDVAVGARVRAGIYVMRLSQQDRSDTRRVCITP